MKMWFFVTGGSSRGSDDADIVARVARGDSKALKSLFERHSPRAMAVALRILHNKSDAEEVLQEAFLEVWRRSREYSEARGQVVGWITTIVRTRAIDRLRARGSNARVVREAALEPEPARGPSPLEDVAQAQYRQRVGAALAALPAEQRQVIELAYFEGLSQSEIAERVGEPLGTVKTRVRLAFQKLAALLGELNHEVMS